MQKNIALLGTFAIGVAFGGTAATLTPSVAQAQVSPPTCGGKDQPGCNTIESMQNQNGDVSARVTITGGKITVDYSALPPGSTPLPPEVTATTITSTSSAIANSVSAKVQSDLQLTGTITQTLNGNVSAYNTVTTQSAVPGEVTLLSSAYGNTAQGEACCGGINLSVKQTIASGSVLADTKVTTAPGLGSLVIASTASGNAIGTSVTNGTLDLIGDQTSYGTITANSSGMVCCNNKSITVASNAVGNTSSSASENSTVVTDNKQVNRGDISANASHVTGSGTEILSVAQATGNSVYTTNKWGYSEADANQYNHGKVSSSASLTANNYKKSADVGATSTGNSILLSSQGASGGIYGYQYNGLGGDITSAAFLDGASNSGGVAQASSTAIGNAITGYACASCSTGAVKMEGGVEQVNNANATANLSLGSTSSVATYGKIVAQASAVGNSATFIAQRNN